MTTEPFEVPKNEELDRVVTFFKAFGDRTRYLIVTILAEGPLTVNELAERLGISQPAMSHQLMILRQAGVVIGPSRVDDFAPSSSPRQSGLGDDPC